MIYLRELTANDAPAVGRIESAVHTAVLADGTEEHRRHLQEAYADSVNLSSGAFEGEKLVGYTLCFGVESTAFPDRTGEVVYIEDIAVLPLYRATTTARLLKRVFGDARKYFPGVAVEGHSLASVFQIWKKHPAFFERMGFTMTQHAETGEVVNGEARYRVRWEPIVEDVDKDKVLAHLLARLSSETLEVNGQSYELKIVRDEHDWVALEQVWDELLLATAEHTVFQSFAYQRLWWRHFGADNELFIVLILRNGVIEGIAPLQVETTHRFARYFRMLGFIGSRWQVDRPTFLFPQNTAALIRVLVRFLAQSTGRWDICELYEQRAEREGFQILQEEFRAAGYLVAVSEDSACPYLEFQGTWEQYLANKSSLFRKNLKTAGRRLRDGGEVQYRLYDAEADVMKQLEIYRDIETRSWKSAHDVGMSRNDDYFSFHQEMAEAFACKRGFLMRMLTVDGKPIAGTFGLEYDGVFYSLQIAHDREYARCSPGTYLEALEMEECFSRGNREYEFLGGFLNNKSRWTSTFRLTKQLHVYRRTPRFTLMYWIVYHIKPWVKERVRPYMKSWRQVKPGPALEHE